MHKLINDSDQEIYRICIESYCIPYKHRKSSIWLYHLWDRDFFFPFEIPISLYKQEVCKQSFLVDG